MLPVLGFLGYGGQLGRWRGQKLAFATVDPQAHFKPLGWPALWTYALQLGPSAGPGSCAASGGEAAGPHFPQCFAARDRQPIPGGWGAAVLHLSVPRRHAREGDVGTRVDTQ